MGLFDRLKKEKKSDVKNKPYIIEKLELDDEYLSSSLGNALFSAIGNIIIVFRQEIYENSSNKVIEIKNLITFDDSKISSPNKIGSDLEKIIELLKNKEIIAPHEQPVGYRLTPNGKDFLVGYLKNTGVLKNEFNTKDKYN